MLSESEAIIQLAIMVGIILCLPYVLLMLRILRKYLVAWFFPPKFLYVEITDDSNKTRVQKLDLEDDKALVEALLKLNGTVHNGK